MKKHFLFIRLHYCFCKNQLNRTLKLFGSVAAYLVYKYFPSICPALSQDLSGWPLRHVTLSNRFVSTLSKIGTRTLKSKARDVGVKKSRTNPVKNLTICQCDFVQCPLRISSLHIMHEICNLRFVIVTITLFRLPCQSGGTSNLLLKAAKNCNIETVLRRC